MTTEVTGMKAMVGATLLDGNGAIKVKDGDEVIATFEPALLMRITYTRAAWNAILERDYDVPRIAYLPWEGTAWAEEWLEFEVDEENIHAPGEDGPDGFLEIFIDELPDPLIGDC